MKIQRTSSNAGFSIIEIVLTIGILMIFTVAIVSMMRSGFEIRVGLAQSARATQRLNVAMQRVCDDLQQVLYVDPNDESRGGSYRTTKTMFKIEPGSETDKITFTAISHRPLMANSGEPDQTFIVYEVKEDPNAPGEKNLYRGEMPIVTTDFKQDPPMRILARNIKKFKVIAWKGDDWLKDRWDTERGDTKRTVPRMVRLEMETLAADPEPAESGSRSLDTASEPTVAMKTVVAIPAAFQFKELRTPFATIKWY